jgi:hypothetical protein
MTVLFGMLGNEYSTVILIQSPNRTYSLSENEMQILVYEAKKETSRKQAHLSTLNTVKYHYFDLWYPRCVSNHSLQSGDKQS